VPVGSWSVDVYSAVAEYVLAYEDVLVSVLRGRLMNRRFRVVLALLSTAVYVTGCGNQPAGYSRAYGKLLYKGEPAAGAFLVFHLEGKSQSADDVVPSATVENDGSFEVVSPTGNGAPAGKYKVLVSWPIEVLAGEAPTETKARKKAKSGASQRRNRLDTLAKDKLKGRYFNVDTPLTTVEVKAETTDLGLLEIKE
jgi:hypothetical protein